MGQDKYAQLKNILNQIIEARKAEDEDLIKSLQMHLLIEHGVKIEFQ